VLYKSIFTFTFWKVSDFPPNLQGLSVSALKTFAEKEGKIVEMSQNFGGWKIGNPNFCLFFIVLVFSCYHDWVRFHKGCEENVGERSYCMPYDLLSVQPTALEH